MKYQSSAPTSFPHEGLLCKACCPMHHTILSGSLQRGRRGKWLKTRTRVVGRICWNYSFFSNVFLFFSIIAFLRKNKPLSLRRLYRLLKHLRSTSLHSPTLRTVLGRSPRIRVPIGKFLGADGVDSGVIRTAIPLPSRK